MKNADPFVGTRYIKDVTWDTNNIARKGQTPIISPRLLVKPTAYARSAGLAAYSGVVGIIYSSLVLPAATPVAVVLAVGTGMRATNQLGEAGWAELVSLKTNGSLKEYTLAINTQGMKDQYICHQMVPIAMGKPSWNLDQKRPNIGLFKTLYNSCNP